jgi:hypothetical protein
MTREDAADMEYRAEESAYREALDLLQDDHHPDFVARELRIYGLSDDKIAAIITRIFKELAQ